jgi:serine/threonine protein kinase
LVPPIDFQLDPTKDLLFLVFPDRGLNANEFLTKRLKTSVSFICGLLLDVCEALLFLHRRGLCHRDVKLENICISNGRAYLIDLETVRETGFKYRGVVGTIGYLPKSLLGKWSQHVVEESNDVFALRLMGLQLFSGQCLDWYPKIGFICPLQLLTRVPEELWDCFVRMFDEDPQYRPQLIELTS